MVETSNCTYVHKLVHVLADIEDFDGGMKVGFNSTQNVNQIIQNKYTKIDQTNL